MPPAAVALGGAVIGGIASNRAADTAADASRDSAAAQAQAAQAAIAEQQRSRDQGLELQGVEQAGFLTDPNAQFDFLQGNPLFQMGLDNLNTQTQNIAAARGRLSAGDTFQQLTKNSLLAASPLIQGQKNSIEDLLNFGSGTSRAQANTAIGAGSNISNLITDQGAANAAGIVGQANAQNQGTQGLLDAALLAGNAIPGILNPATSNPAFTNPIGGGSSNPFQFDLVNRV